jgi:putative transposase
MVYRLARSMTWWLPLGLELGISKSEVSRTCAELDRDLEAFRTRPLGHVEFPSVFCDATHVKCRVNGRVVSKAVVIATSVTRNGDREVLGCAVGDSEDGAFWTAFFRSLRARGLSGVPLVISDAHEGLKAAIASTFIGAAWQRCRVRRPVFVRGIDGEAPRTIFDLADRTHICEHVELTTAPPRWASTQR